MVVGLNLGGLKFNFIFAKRLVWPEYERVETTLASEKALVFQERSLNSSFKQGNSRLWELSRLISFGL